MTYHCLVDSLTRSSELVGNSLLVEWSIESIESTEETPLVGWLTESIVGTDLVEWSIESDSNFMKSNPHLVDPLLSGVSDRRYSH